MIVDLESEIQNHNGVSLLCKEVNLNASVMKDILFQIGKNRKDLVAVLGSKKTTNRFCHVMFPKH
ncbi:MAG: hypothetical protein CM15mP83_5510 [Flavobacteriaceae bacterium]|nr:MAG: hypothetical protein CM15mP83_5510 [Flavobacteriaceae bacterium]